MSISLQGIRETAANAMNTIGHGVNAAKDTVVFYGSKITSSVRPALDALVSKVRSVSDLAPSFMKNDLVKGLGLGAFAIGLFVLARRYQGNIPVQTVCIVAGAILLAGCIKLAIVNPAAALAASRV